jgi:3-hydroxyacyl-CoA dehydrogenase
LAWPRSLPRRKRPAAGGFLRESDSISFNRDHLIYDAKQVALGLLRAGYRPPRQRLVRLPGPSGFANIRSSLQMMLESHQILPHDLVVGSALAKMLTGGNTSPTVKHDRAAAPRSRARGSSWLCGEAEDPRSHDVHAPKQQAAAKLARRLVTLC